MPWSAPQIFNDDPHAWLGPLNELRAAATERLSLQAGFTNVPSNQFSPDQLPDPNDPDYTPQSLNDLLRLTITGFMNLLTVPVGDYNASDLIPQYFPEYRRHQVRTGTILSSNSGFGAVITNGTPANVTPAPQVGDRLRETSTERTWRVVEADGFRAGIVPDFDSDPDIVELGGRPQLGDLLTTDFANALQEALNGARWFIGSNVLQMRDKSLSDAIQQGTGPAEVNNPISGWNTPLSEVYSELQASLDRTSFDEDNPVFARSFSVPLRVNDIIDGRTPNGRNSIGTERGHDDNDDIVSDGEVIATLSSNHGIQNGNSLPRGEIFQTRFSPGLPAAGFGPPPELGGGVDFAGLSFEASVYAAFDIDNFGIRADERFFRPEGTGVADAEPNKFYEIDSFSSTTYISPYYLSSEAISVSPVPRGDLTERLVEEYGFNAYGFIPIYRFDVPGGLQFVD